MNLSPENENKLKKTKMKPIMKTWLKYEREAKQVIRARAPKEEIETKIRKGDQTMKMRQKNDSNFGDVLEQH